MVSYVTAVKGTRLEDIRRMLKKRMLPPAQCSEQDL